VKVELQPFLTSAQHEGEWSASSSSHFIAGVRARDIHLTGGWVDDGASLEAVTERKENSITAPAWN